MSKNRKSVYVAETRTTYPTVRAAAQAIGVNSGNVSQVVSGKRKTAGGYHFYDATKVIINPSTGKVYTSPGTAAHALGVRKDRLQDVLSGRRKSVAGLTADMLRPSSVGSVSSSGAAPTGTIPEQVPTPKLTSKQQQQQQRKAKKQARRVAQQKYRENQKKHIIPDWKNEGYSTNEHYKLAKKISEYIEKIKKLNDTGVILASYAGTNLEQFIYEFGLEDVTPENINELDMDMIEMFTNTMDRIVSKDKTFLNDNAVTLYKAIIQRQADSFNVAPETIKKYMPLVVSFWKAYNANRKRLGLGSDFVTDVALAMERSEYPLSMETFSRLIDALQLYNNRQAVYDILTADLPDDYSTTDEYDF